MKALGYILLYLAATVLFGALLAPPLFWGMHAAAGHLHNAPLSAFVAKAEFQRYVDRGILIAALAFLWPLLRALGIGSISGGLGLKRDRWGWLRLVAGLFAAVAMLAVMWGLLYHLGVCRPRSHIAYGSLAWQIALTATVVSVIEEFFFRGVLQGAVRRTAVDGFSVVSVAVLFAAVHFLKPGGAVVPPADVHWTSGLAVLPNAALMFRQPALLLGGFGTLLLAGLILGYAREWTGSLWMPIGLHAGWIIGEKGIMAGTRHSVFWPWLGPDIPNTLVGLAPVLTLILTGAIVWLLLRLWPE